MAFYINPKAQEWIDAGYLYVGLDENGRWRCETGRPVSMKVYHVKCGAKVSGAIPGDVAAKLFAGCRQDERTAPAKSFAILECSHWQKRLTECPWVQKLSNERMSITFEEQSLLGRLKFYANVVYRRRDVPCVEHANLGRVGRFLALAKRWFKRHDKPLSPAAEDGKQGHGDVEKRGRVHAS